MPGAGREPAGQRAEVDVQKGSPGVMETFDNTRPLVAGMAVGVAAAALDRTRELLKKAGCKFDYREAAAHRQPRRGHSLSPGGGWRARLLTLKAAWMADNKLPNSKGSVHRQGRAGRVANEITLKCVELAGALGYAEDELLEKWARDSKILDIFEGTQQIQLLIVARRLLGKSSSQLK
ncbi:acyl-CoA dehydrogenase family protein [Pseudomonas aeruginosa]